MARQGRGSRSLGAWLILLRSIAAWRRCARPWRRAASPSTPRRSAWRHAAEGRPPKPQQVASAPVERRAKTGPESGNPGAAASRVRCGVLHPGRARPARGQAALQSPTGAT